MKPDRKPDGERCDVLVVGAGPTGLTLAHLLSLHGVSVIVVEQSATTVGEPRAVSIDDESMRTLQTIGLADTVLRDMAPAYGLEYVGPDRKVFAVVRPSRSEYGWPKRSAFRQPLLEHTLLETARQRPGVSIRMQTRCVDHRDCGDHVVVTIEDASGRRNISCAYLVGADGGRSRTRKAIGAELSGSSFEERWLIVDLKETRDIYRDTHVHCDPERPAITLPGPHRTRRYEMLLMPGETAEEMENETRARELLRRYGVDGDSPIERLRVYTFQARVADKWRQGRVFLAGDAAHLMPPFAGQNLNSGFRDASNLAWKLAAVLRGRLGPALLDTYQPERRTHAWSMVRLSLTIGFVMAPRNRFVGAATRAVFRLASLLPPARDWLAQMKFKPKPRFREGFCVISGELSRRLAGTMFPQPAVEQEGRSIRLDDVIGPGFAFLCFGSEPARLAAQLGDLPRHLDAAVIGCLPRAFAFPLQPFAPLVRDGTGDIGAALNNAEAVVLLRPDRYVAVVLEPDRIEETRSALQRLLAGTFEASDRRHASAADAVS